MKYSKEIRKCDLEAITELAHEVGASDLRIRFSNGWGETMDVPNILFGDHPGQRHITLAEKLNALLDHLGLEIVVDQKVRVRERKP